MSAMATTGAPEDPTSSVLARRASARPGRDGLPYLVIEDALPADPYAGLAASFPSAEAVAGRADLPGNAAFRRSAHEALDDPGTPAVWRDFFAYHTSPAFFGEVRRLWRAEIGRYF